MPTTRGVIAGAISSDSAIEGVLSALDAARIPFEVIFAENMESADFPNRIVRPGDDISHYLVVSEKDRPLATSLIYRTLSAVGSA